MMLGFHLNSLLSCIYVFHIAKGLILRAGTVQDHCADSSHLDSFIIQNLTIRNAFK